VIVDIAIGAAIATGVFLLMHAHDWNREVGGGDWDIAIVGVVIIAAVGAGGSIII